MTSSAARSDRLRTALKSDEDRYFHLRCALILGIGNAVDAIETLSIGYILAVYEDSDGVLSRTAQGSLAAAAFAGMLVGGLVFGTLSDRIGRRQSFLISMLINGGFATLSALASNATLLILCRTCAGIGIGGTIPAMFTLCSEHVPPRRRGYYVTIVAANWMVGSLFASGVAWLMLGNEATNTSWQAFAVVVSLPAYICWLLTYLFVPESIHYYVGKRDLDKAEAVLDYMQTVDRKSDWRTVPTAMKRTESEGEPLVAINTLEKHSSGEDVDKVVEAMEEDNSYSFMQACAALLHPLLAETTISLFLSWLCLSFGSYGLSTWITVLFQRIDLSNPFANAFIYAGATLPGNVLSALLMDRMGARWFFIISMLIAACCAAGFAYASAKTSPSSSASASTSITVLVIALASGFNAFSTAGWNAVDLMSAESFPTDVRTTGMGILAAGGRIGSISAQFVNGYLVGPPPHVTALLSVTATMTLLACASALVVRDFKGKALVDSMKELQRNG